MSERIWKIGVSGLRRGLSYGRLLVNHPQCRMTACFDPSTETTARFQEHTQLPDAVFLDSFDALLAADLDAVIVASPIPCHAEQTIRAMESGRHVLSEVTMAETVEKCQTIIDAQRRTGRIYMFGENCVYWPFLKEWKRWIRAGRLGDIVHAECEYLHPLRDMLVEAATGKRTWRADRPPVIYCTHSLGPVLDILDDRVVRAMGIGTSEKALPHVGVGAVDVQCALFETTRGVTIKLLRSNIVPLSGFHHHYRFQGTRGHVATLPYPEDRRGWLYVEGEMERGEETPCSLVDASLPPEAQDGGHGTAEYELLADFFRAMATGEPPALDARRGWDFTVPGLTALASIERNGAWLPVPEPQ